MWALPKTQNPHHEVHEGHEEEIDLTIKLRALRGLRGETTCYILTLLVCKAGAGRRAVLGARARQRKPEGAALAGCAFNADAAAVGFDGQLAEGEA